LLDARCSLLLARYWILVAGCSIMDVLIEDFQIISPVKWFFDLGEIFLNFTPMK
jgi:hypothetical protein